MLSVSPTIQSILNSDSKEVSWLFEQELDSMLYYWSTKNKTFDGEDYENRIIPKSFSGIQLNSSMANYGIMAPNKITFTVSDPDNEFLTYDFKDQELTVKLVLNNSVNEEIVARWKFYVLQAKKINGIIEFVCEDFFSRYLKGTYPTTARISSLSPSDDNLSNDNLCVPVFFGTGYLPIRNLYISDARYYVLGPSGPTYTISEFRSPLNWDSVNIWDNSYTYTQSDKSLNGDNYRTVQPIIVDSDSDGTADANGLFFKNNQFLDGLIKYTRSDTVSITSPEDIIEYVLEDMGVPSLNIDTGVNSSFAAAGDVYSDWGLSFNGGFFTIEDKMKILSSLLTQCNSVLRITDKVELHVLSKTSVKTLDSSSIRSNGEGKESSFKYRYTEKDYIDSCYVTFVEDGAPQSILKQALVSIDGSLINPAKEAIQTNLVLDTQDIQRIGILKAQRKYNIDEIINLNGRDDLLVLQPDDVITISGDKYAGSYSAIVQSVKIKLDLTVSIQVNKFDHTLDDWNDLSPGAISIETDNSTSVFTTVVQGPDDANNTNMIGDRVRIGSGIVLDGGAESIVIGNLSGDGISLDSTNGQRMYDDGTLKGQWSLDSSWWLGPNSTNKKVEWNPTDDTFYVRGNAAFDTMLFQEVMTTKGTIRIAISGGDLFEGITATATTFTIKITKSPSGGAPFTSGDRCQIDNGINSTWFTVGSGSDQTYYWEYTATYQSGSNSASYDIGTVITDYGQSGDGGIIMSADMSNAPWIAIFKHSGSPWSDMEYLVKMGNLNGYAGYSSDIYGFAAYIDADNYITIDPTDGIQMSGEITITSFNRLPSDEYLEGYWSFDDGTGATAVDNSGNGYDLTLYNTPLWVSGISGNGIDVNGSNQYGRNTSLDPPNPISISVWVNADDFNQEGFIVRYDTAVYFSLHTTGKVRFFQYNITYNTLESSVTLNADEWYHIVVVYDGTTGADSQKIYINGELDNSNAADGTTYANTSADLYVGAQSVSINRFNGTIDELRIYNKVLTASEVKALYLNPSGNKSQTVNVDSLTDGTTYGFVNQAVLDSNYLSILRRSATANQRIDVTATGIEQYTNSVKMIELASGNLYLGDQSNKHSLINSSGMTVYDGATAWARFASTTYIGDWVTGDEFIQIDSSGVEITSGGEKVIDIDGSGVGVFNILAGGDIILTGDNSNPAKLTFNGTSYDTSLCANFTTGSQIRLVPDTTDVVTLSLGTSDYRFYQGLIYGQNSVFLDAKASANEQSFINLSTSGGSDIRVSVTNSGSTYQWFFEAGAFRPTVDSVSSCGTSSYCWTNIYADAGVTSCSDKKLKDILGQQTLGLDFIKSLVTIMWKWNKLKGDNVSNKTFRGLAAQDVEQVLIEHNIDPDDFAGLNKGKDAEGNPRYGLNYEQLLFPPLINAIQELDDKLETVINMKT